MYSDVERNRVRAGVSGTIGVMSTRPGRATSTSTTRKAAKAKPKAAAKPKAKPTTATKAKASAKAAPGPSAVADTDAIRIVLAGADSVEVGGFAALTIVGWHRDQLIVTCPILEHTAALDLGAVPSIRPLADAFAQACGSADDGRLVLLLGLRSAARHVRVYPPSLEPTKANDLLLGKKPLEFAAVGFVDGRVLAVPGYLGTHRRYGHVHAAVPYVEERGALRPVPGLTRDAGGAAPELTGFARCGDGGTLIVWGGRGFRWTGDGLARVAEVELATSHTNAGLTTAPAARGCFVVSGRALTEVAIGAAPRRHLDGQACRLVRPGPDGRVLVELIPDDGPPRLALCDPARGVAVEVAVPDDVYPNTAAYVPARRAIAVLARSSAGTAGHRIALVPIAPAAARLR